MIYTHYVKTEFGIFVLKGDEETITSITVVKKVGKNSAKIPEYMKHIKKTIIEYTENPKISLKSIDFKICASQMQSDVWNALLGVQLGKTISYSALAKKSGYPKAVRAVATAVTKNPLLVIIPCHRVIRKNGDIGNYAGGVPMKKALLAHEGVM